MLVDRGRRLAAAITGTTLLGLLVAGCGERPEASPRTAAKPTQAVKKVTPPHYATLDAVPERLSADGTTIVVGSPNAPTTVHLYEDLRCPVCRDFEVAGAGPELRDMTLRGEVKAEYTLASFLDDSVGGQGSKNAVNALRAALEKGKFAEYHAVLFEHQPEEAVDGYTDRFLLRMAKKVKGLRSPAFDKAVKNMKYRSFVKRSEQAYEASGVSGTPNMAVDGHLLVGDMRAALFDGELLADFMSRYQQRDQPWSPAPTDASGRSAR